MQDKQTRKTGDSFWFLDQTYSKLNALILLRKRKDDDDSVFIYFTITLVAHSLIFMRQTEISVYKDFVCILNPVEDFFVDITS